VRPRRAARPTPAWGSVAAASCAALLFVAVVAVTPGIASDDPQATSTPLLPPQDDPATLEAERDAAAREEAEQAQLATPAAHAERVESREAFEDQSTAEALATARSNFGDFMSDPFWLGPDLLSGERISRYLDDYSALVAQPDGPSIVMESTAPLRARTDSGEMRPVDPTLVGDADALVPKNVPGDTRIARDSTDAATLGDSGIGVGVPTPGTGGDVKVLDDKAFYANVGEGADTDLIVGSTPHGIEAAFQLRSAESPSDPSLTFDLPTGAQLRLQNDLGGAGDAPPGAVSVIRDGDDLATVMPPIATDADGQSVDAAYEVRGTELAVRVDHRGRDLRYPILVDPYVVEDYQGNQSDFYAANNAGPDWAYFESPTPNDHYDGAKGGTAPGGIGLRLNMPAGWSYDAFSGAQFQWQAPPDTKIVRTDFLRVAHDLNSSRVMLGILGCCPLHWEGDPDPPDHKSNTPFLITSEQPDLTRIICTDTVSPCSSGGASWQNVVVYRFESTGGGRPRANSNYTAMNQAKISLWENLPPFIESVTHTTGAPPAGWVDQGSYHFYVKAGDRGLGVNRMSFRRPSTSSPPAVMTSDIVGTRGFLSCAGHRDDPCPKNGQTGGRFPTDGGTYDYDVSDLPEGIDELGLKATDFVGNPSSGDWVNPTYKAYTWNVKVDRTKPVIDPLKGALYEDRNFTTADGFTERGLITAPEDVLVNTHDGTATTPASGVASIEMRVDGQLVRPAEHRYTATCSSTGCPYAAPADKKFTLYPSDFPDAKDRKVEIKVRDQLGHERVETFWVYVDPHPEPEPPEVSISLPGAATDPASDPGAQLTQDMKNDALDLIDDAADDGTSPLHAVLGSSGYTPTEIGQLTAGEDANGDPVIVGAVVTLSLSAPKAVDAIVPAFASPADQSANITKYSAHFVGASVDEIVVAVDLTALPGQELIEIEPGLETDADYTPSPEGTLLPIGPEEGD
jgi:hypothetical protein